MGLRSYITTRIILTIPMIMLLLTIVFVVVRVLPGDPVLLHFEKYEDPEAVQAMRRRLGMDKPLIIQYFEYLRGLFNWPPDLGKSMQDFQPIAQHIFSAFPATLELAIYSMVIAVIIGLLLGVRASRSYNKPLDHIIRAFGTITYAIPVFFLGMILQLTFGVGLGWFPTGGGRTAAEMEPVGLTLHLGIPAEGFVSPLLRSLPAGLAFWVLGLAVLRWKHVKFWRKGFLISLSAFFVGWLVWALGAWYFMCAGGLHVSTGLYTIDSLLEGNIAKFVQAVRYLFLPSLTLGLVLCGVFIRMVRSNMLETLRLDFVTAGRARGLKERVLVYGYALRNAFLPVLTMMGLQFAALLGGAVLTETTFSWPGLGGYISAKIMQRDYTAIQGAVVVFGLFVALVSLVVDVLYAYLDPRIRL